MREMILNILGIGEITERRAEGKILRKAHILRKTETRRQGRGDFRRRKKTREQ